VFPSSEQEGHSWTASDADQIAMPSAAVQRSVKSRASRAAVMATSPLTSELRGPRPMVR
jgi:hypothetical protein